MKTTMVCLALSRKHSNICVAGYDLNNNTMIRPVIFSTIRCIPPSFCNLDNGKQLQTLDIVEIDVTGHCPDGCQTENFTVNINAQWKYIGTFDKTNLDGLIHTTPTLWYNGISSFNGLNDKITTNFADTMFTQSMYFIKLH